MVHVQLASWLTDKSQLNLAMRAKADKEAVEPTQP